MNFIKSHVMEYVYQLVDRINMDPVILLMIYIFSACPFMFFSLGMELAGKVCVAPDGFAVDSSGLVYIGQNSIIKVYENNELIRTISPITNRGYAFTIQSDDTILLSTASIVYILDLDGNKLSQSEENAMKIMNDLQTSRKRFRAANGDQYTMKSPFGRIKIVRNGNEVVYKMPTWEYAVKLLLFFSFGSLIIFIPFIAIKWRRVYPNGI